MALVIKDRVKETTTTTGTGAISLGGATTNFVTFSSVLSNADTTYYAIVDTNNSAFEVGLGTYASSGNTLTRTTVLASSNSGSAVDLQAGTKSIFCAFPADKAVIEDSDGTVSIENLKVDTNTISSTNTDGNIALTPNGAGKVVLDTGVEVTNGTIDIKNGGSVSNVKFYCESGNAHYTQIQSALHAAYSGNVTLTLPTVTGNLIGSNASGKVSLSGTTSIAEIIEKVTVQTSTTGTINFDFLTQAVELYTANQTANRTINFRGDGSTTLNSIMAVGESMTAAILMTQGSSAYYLNAYQVDGSSVTPEWSGGSAPSAGNASSIDSYTFTIIKTADATFTVLASQIQFA
jgi:hypothetical protein|tara:strand:+ start:413 stop:1456 length:1044 start_codon:yes stop_codon:yes gene_type:complete